MLVVVNVQGLFLPIVSVQKHDSQGAKNNLFVWLTSHHLNERSVGHPGGVLGWLLGEEGREHSQVLKVLAMVTLWQVDNNSPFSRQEINVSTGIIDL